MKSLLHEKNDKLKVCVDTNIYISAAISPKGSPARLLGGAIDGRWHIVISPYLLFEILEVIHRKEVRSLISAPDEFYDFVKDSSCCVYPLERIDIVKSDPSDNIILEAAIAGNVDCIVSGDKHLLELKCYRDIPIYSAQEFLNVYADHKAAR